MTSIETRTADVPVNGSMFNSEAMVDAAYRHLVEFQAIADRNGGQRASGTPGHELSADYVADRLTAAGLTVTSQEFPIGYCETVAERLTVAGRAVGVTVMRHSPNTPPGGITGRLAVLPADRAGGCEPSDFDGVDCAGKIVLVRRGGCRLAIKAQNAAAAGAIGMLVYNFNDEWLLGSLGAPGQAGIPAGGISKADGEALRAMENASVTLDLRMSTEPRSSRNIIAQTSHGRTDRVVMAGAHLDSVVEGPGINDAGTGCAALIELAVRLQSAPRLHNAVRFAFWGAEELGQVGSNHYLRGLTEAQLRDIALYLTVDMLGSTNAGYFVFEGADGPDGSQRLEKSLVDGLAEVGVQAQGLSLIGGFDHMPFVAAGVPCSGLYTGATGIKTAEHARLWGGRAGLPFDPGYHQLDDNLANVDLDAFGRNMRAFAQVLKHYATSKEIEV